jgi:general secretion pathway protein H
MPISARGTSSGRGFTLIELLVVLLIMGIAAGLIGAIVRPDDRALLQAEAERLAQLLELAAEESRLTGKRIAWTAEGAQYRFWRWRDDAGWSEEGDDTLRARRLPAGMAITDLRIEAKPAPGGLRLEFDPHGALAYDFRMSLGESSFSVTASPVGEVRIDAPS